MIDSLYDTALEKAPNTPITAPFPPRGKAGPPSRKTRRCVRIPPHRKDEDAHFSQQKHPASLSAGEQYSPRRVKAAFLAALHERMKQSENPSVNTPRRAILYALERSDTLMTWLTVPQIPIDNNAAEQAIRPLAVWRRNSLFIGSPDAGKRAAILYTRENACG